MCARACVYVEGAAPSPPPAPALNTHCTYIEGPRLFRCAGVLPTGTVVNSEVVEGRYRTWGEGGEEEDSIPRPRKRQCPPAIPWRSWVIRGFLDTCWSRVCTQAARFQASCDKKAVSCLVLLGGQGDGTVPSPRLGLRAQLTRRCYLWAPVSGDSVDSTAARGEGSSPVGSMPG